MASPLSLSAGFERNTNTFLWDLTGASTLRSSSWRLSAQNRFQRSLIKAGGESLKDQNSFNLESSADLFRNAELRSAVTSFSFTDNRVLGLNNLTTTRALVGVSWKLFDMVQFTPMVGYSIDNQQGIRDDGFSYSMQTQLAGLDLGQATARSEFVLSAEHISPRYQYDHRGSAEISARIGENSVNTASVNYRENRREYYQNAADIVLDQAIPIESRREQSISVRDMLQYAVFKSVSLLASMDLSQRNIWKNRNTAEAGSSTPYFSTFISEFTLNTSAQLVYASERTRGTIRLDHNERDEFHELNPQVGTLPADVIRQMRLEEQKNNSIRQIQLGIDLSRSFGRSDTLSMSGALLKMQYDTPSEENFDDRDEIIFLTGLRWARRFSTEFSASLYGDLAMRHTVYIFSQRSANNTWNRVLRLAPSGELRLSQSFVSKNAAELVANYTVYDFEDAAQGQRSFSLRQLSLTDSTAMRLHGSLWIDAALHLRWYERGELRWAAFTVRPVQFFQEQTFSLALRRRENNWDVSVGVRYFEQRRYRYAGNQRFPDAQLTNYGPTVQIQCTFFERSRIVVDGWYQLTDEAGRPKRSTPNVLLHTTWYL
ncbi:MAG: hypothetical protein M5R41_13590 [Bacteroidia bacterium]|nr:hypothetical protein [Bacteroidia bacterium]